MRTVSLRFCRMRSRLTLCSAPCSPIRAISKPASAPILATHQNLSFHQGPYAYSIERHGDQSLYRVRSGAEEFSTPVVWAFGLGAAGQTYLLNRDGHWYESRVSYYKQIDGLDLT